MTWAELLDIFFSQKLNSFTEVVIYCKQMQPTYNTINIINAGNRFRMCNNIAYLTFLQVFLFEQISSKFVHYLKLKLEIFV